MRVTEWMQVILIGLDILIGVALAYVGVKTAKIDKLEDRLQKKAEELVDARYSAMAREIRIQVDQFGEVVQEMRHRLKMGDEKFDKDDEQRHKLELKTVQQLAELKTIISEKFASKADLESLRESMHRLSLELARMQR
jgi:hypothetical protein